MNSQFDPVELTIRTFEIDSTNFRLQAGQSVSPQTVIGRDFRTGEILFANCFGHVAGISFNPFNHALLVAVSGSDEIRRARVPSYEEAFNGFQS